VGLLKRVNERSDICYSALVIAGYTVMFLDLSVEENRKLFHRVLKETIGHALSNHGVIRKGGQSVIVKVYEHLKKNNVKNVDQLLEQISPLYDYIQANEECMKVLSSNSSIFQHFHSLGEVTPELIFYQLTTEEAFPLSEQILPEVYQMLLEHNSKAPVSNLQQTGESDENSKNEVQTPASSNAVVFEDFQKKILPWESTFSQNSLSEALSYEETVYRDTLLTTRPRSEIIIVATLIDKVPNLAGLARTCEIFNATALVFSSRKFERDPAFQDISVTAEKWVPIWEVPENELGQFLEDKKNEGWALLGVEQTANSKSLTEYKFPKKSVLLLGKEKEGIPVEFIQMLDECIEIPQLGIIRSLNVHVSGSIMLWEYTKQQLIAKKNGN